MSLVPISLGIEREKFEKLASLIAPTGAQASSLALQSIQIEVVFQLHKGGDDLSATHRRYEPDRSRGGDCLLSQSTAEWLDCTNVGHLPGPRKNDTEDYRSRDLLSPSFFCVLWFRFG